MLLSDFSLTKNIKYSDISKLYISLFNYLVVAVIISYLAINHLNQYLETYESLFFAVFYFILFSYLRVYELSKTGDYRAYAHCRIDESLRKRLAVHEAGHALVRMCFFPKSTIIDKVSRFHEESIALASVNGFTEDNIKEIIKRYGHYKYKIIYGYMTISARFAEILIYGNAELDYFDNQDLKENGINEEVFYENITLFLESNLDILIEIAKLILQSKKNQIDFGDFGHLVHKIQNKNLLTKTEH